MKHTKATKDWTRKVLKLFDEAIRKHKSFGLLQEEVVMGKEVVKEARRWLREG